MLIASADQVLAQFKTYDFNVPGNICYFSYIMYSATGDYTSTRRPYMVVIGKEASSALQTYTADSLKSLPQYYNHLFIYLPNQVGGNRNKLYCLEPLLSLITGSYSHGRGNLFLYVTDPTLGASDLQASGLGQVFKSVVFAGDNSAMSIDASFREDVEAYDAPAPGEDLMLGTYYVEETKNLDTSPKVAVDRKVYFGAPSAYDFSLSGVVKDQTTGETLPFATIQVKGTTNGTSSNADGFFTLRNTPTDTSAIVVGYLGYRERVVFLTPDMSKKHLVISLSPASQMLNTVDVIGVKEEVLLSKKDEVGIIKMTPKKLQQLPNLGEKDVMRSLQLMPGVSAANESSAGLYVRGGTPDQNLVLYDGFTIYHVDHLYGFFSAFNANALKDVQLYKGGFESKFGGRLSSVTEITGKDGNQKKFNIGGDLSLLSLNLFAEVPIGDKFTSVIAYRRSYKGALYNTIFEKFNTATAELGNGGTPPSGGPGGMNQQETKVTNFFYDLNGKFTYRPTDRDVISLSIFNGRDKLDNSSSFAAPSFGGSDNNFSSTTTDLTKYGNVGTSLKWSRKWTDKFYANTVLSYSYYFSDRDRTMERTSEDTDGNETTTKNGIIENNNLRDYSLKSDYQWDVLKRNQLQFGLFTTYFDIDYTYAQNDTTTILNKSNKSWLKGGYVQDKIKLFNDKLIVLPGIRASYFGQTAKWYYEPRATITWSVSKRLSLKGATGRYYQFANRVTREDILSGSKDFWLLSDSTHVPVSSAEHYIAGISYELPDYLFSVEGYYKNIHNLTEYSLRFNPSPFDVSYDENFLTGEGNARGVEFLVQKKSGKFNGWASYTLAQARNHFETYRDDWYPANQDVTNEFKIVGIYKYKRWDFSATWIYASGRPYTAPSGAYSITLLDGTTQDFFTVTAKNGLRLPDYHRADLSATYKLLRGSSEDKRRKELGYIGFSIFNVYNRINVWYRQYSIEEGEVIQTNVNYLGIIPNLTLSLKLH